MLRSYRQRTTPGRCARAHHTSHWLANRLSPRLAARDCPTQPPNSQPTKLGAGEYADSGIIRKAREVNADIIALSSLLSTTMPYQREVIEDLRDAGLRDRFKVIVGGGPVTKEWADKIGADGFGRDASEALIVARQLVGQKRDERAQSA